MAFAPLIVRHNLTIDGNPVNNDLIAFAFGGTRAEIEIPETAGLPKSYAGGGDEYTCSLEFLADLDDAAISMILFDALIDPDGTIDLAGTFRPGAISPSNKVVVANALVSSMGEVGGQQSTVSRSSVTFKLTGRPQILDALPS